MQRFHFYNFTRQLNEAVIAELLYASMVSGRYDLYTYDSRTDEWATKMALLRQEQELGHHSSPPIHTPR